MDEFFAVLEACGARRVTRQEELEPLRSAWSEHWRYLAGRKTPITCFGCDKRLEGPYATWSGQTSFGWCIDCARLMPVFGEPGGDPVVGMENFTWVIVCARVGPAPRKETSDPP